MGRADRVHNKTSTSKIRTSGGVSYIGNVSQIGSGDKNAISKPVVKPPQGLIPVAHAQLSDTNPSVNTGGEHIGQEQYTEYPENTANVALERDSSEYSSDHSIERFLTNIGRGAYDTGESYSTDMIQSAQGRHPIRHMKDATLLDVFVAGGLEGRLHDSLAEVGRRAVEEPGRIIGEVAVEAGVMIGSLGAMAALKGVRAGAIGAKVIHAGLKQPIVGYQRTKTFLTRMRGTGTTKFIIPKNPVGGGGSLNSATRWGTTTTINTSNKGKVTLKTQSNAPVPWDPARPLARWIEKSAQPVGEKLRKGVKIMTGGRRGQTKTPTYDAFDPFNEPLQMLSSKYLTVGGEIGSKIPYWIKGANAAPVGGTRKTVKKSTNVFGKSSIPMGTSNIASILSSIDIPKAFGAGPDVPLSMVRPSDIPMRNVDAAVRGMVDLPSPIIDEGYTTPFRLPPKDKVTEGFIGDIATGSVSSNPMGLNNQMKLVSKSEMGYISPMDKITDADIQAQKQIGLESYGGKTDEMNADAELGKIVTIPFGKNRGEEILINKPGDPKLQKHVNNALNRIDKSKKIIDDGEVERITKQSEKYNERGSYTQSADTTATTFEERNPELALLGDHTYKPHTQTSQALGSLEGVSTSYSDIFMRSHPLPIPIGKSAAKAEVTAMWQDGFNRGTNIKTLKKEEDRIIKKYEAEHEKILDKDSDYYVKDMNVEKAFQETGVVAKTFKIKDPITGEIKVVDAFEPPKNIGLGTGVPQSGIGMVPNVNIAKSIITPRTKTPLAEDPSFGEQITPLGYNLHDEFQLPMAGTYKQAIPVTPTKGGLLSDFDYKGPELAGSGFQKGTDMVASIAAHKLGLPITGWMPRGKIQEMVGYGNYGKTEKIDAEYDAQWDIFETMSSSWTKRTDRNVGQFDVTVVFFPTKQIDEYGEEIAITAGSGSARTIEKAVAMGKPVLVNPPDSKTLNDFLKLHNARSVNFAGTRESHIKTAGFLYNVADVISGMKVNTEAIQVKKSLGLIQNIDEKLFKRWGEVFPANVGSAKVGDDLGMHPIIGTDRLLDGKVWTARKMTPMHQPGQSPLTTLDNVAGYSGEATSPDRNKAMKDLEKAIRAEGGDSTRDASALRADDPFISGVAGKLSNVDIAEYLAAGRLNIDQPQVAGYTDFVKDNPEAFKFIRASWKKDKITGEKPNPNQIVDDLYELQKKTDQGKSKPGEEIPWILSTRSGGAQIDMVEEIGRIKEWGTFKKNYETMVKKYKGTSTVKIKKGANTLFGSEWDTSKQTLLPDKAEDYVRVFNLTEKNVKDLSYHFNNVSFKKGDEDKLYAFERASVRREDLKDEQLTIWDAAFGEKYKSLWTNKQSTANKPDKLIPVKELGGDLYTGTPFEETLFTPKNIADTGIGGQLKGEQGFIKNIINELNTIGINRAPEKPWGGGNSNISTNIEPTDLDALWRGNLERIGGISKKEKQRIKNKQFGLIPTTPQFGNWAVKSNVKSNVRKVKKKSKAQQLHEARVQQQRQYMSYSIMDTSVSPMVKEYIKKNKKRRVQENKNPLGLPSEIDMEILGFRGLAPIEPQDGGFNLSKISPDNFDYMRKIEQERNAKRTKWGRWNRGQFF